MQSSASIESVPMINTSVNDLSMRLPFIISLVKQSFSLGFDLFYLSSPRRVLGNAKDDEDHEGFFAK